MAGSSVSLISSESLTVQSCEDSELQQRDGGEAQDAHLEVLSGRGWLWPEPSSLYIRVAIFITAGPDVRATTEPAPSGHRRVTAPLLRPHSRRSSLGAPSSGAERAGCGQCVPNCVQVRLEAQMTASDHISTGVLWRLCAPGLRRLKCIRTAFPYLSAGTMWVTKH